MPYKVICQYRQSFKKWIIQSYPEQSSVNNISFFIETYILNSLTSHIFSYSNRPKSAITPLIIRSDLSIYRWSDISYCCYSSHASLSLSLSSILWWRKRLYTRYWNGLGHTLILFWWISSWEFRNFPLKEVIRLCLEVTDLICIFLCVIFKPWTLHRRRRFNHILAVFLDNDSIFTMTKSGLNVFIIVKSHPVSHIPNKSLTKSYLCRCFFSAWFSLHSSPSATIFRIYFYRTTS